MRTSLVLICTLIGVILAVSASPPRTASRPRPSALLGSKECTWGPTHWCRNITNAAQCHAVKHCIQTVWIQQKLPIDNSEVCQICLDMVKQARDQLRSNETQEDIKAVLEGSCNLMPIKIVRKECCKLADDFTVELVETLASEMNPQVVCATAGLCNSDHVNKLLEETKATPVVKDDCQNCITVVDIMEEKYHKADRTDILQGFLHVCRKFGSFSDACTNTILTYFDDIYNYIYNNFKSPDVCIMAGECSAKFHTHIEVTPLGNVGVIPVSEKDNLPCEFCEQLVQHLRDILITNTTEDEFEKVLEGLCKQTGNFKEQCLAIIGEYYRNIYQFLVTELNPKGICTEVGICSESGLNIDENVPLMPLLPITVNLEFLPPYLDNKNGEDEHVTVIKPSTAVKVLTDPAKAQLPIERLMPQTLTVVGNTNLCVFCEYFLHEMQQYITNPTTEAEIEKIVDEACSKMPSVINETCVSFVSTYGPAVIAILAQEIDPSVVCPRLSLCAATGEADVEVFMQVDGNEKAASCPMCLLAITSLEKLIGNKKTEDSVKAALKKLCSGLKPNVKRECDVFVETYTNQLIELIIADLTPQECCVYLHICVDKAPAPVLPEIVFEGKVSTNEIPDHTMNGESLKNEEQTLISAELIEPSANPECVICEFIMSKLQDELKDKTTEDEIKKAVHGICNHLPQTIKTQCNQFVNQYADLVIQLLISSLQPDQICSVMHMCTKMMPVKVEILDCAICEATVKALSKILTNPKVDKDVKHVLEKACRALPSKNQPRCTELVEKYGNDLIYLVAKLSDSGLVCHEIGLCAGRVNRPYIMF